MLSIEELVQKHFDQFCARLGTSLKDTLRNALTEQAELLRAGWVSSATQLPDEDALVVGLSPHRKARDGYARSLASWTSDPDRWSMSAASFRKEYPYWYSIPPAPVKENSNG